VSRENNGTIHLSQKRKMEELDLRPLSSLSSNRKGSEPASPKDHTAYKSMIGQLLFVGRVSYPPLQYHASHMASKTSALQVHHLRDIMAVVTHSRRTIPQLLFSSEFDPSRPSELVAFSDAALCGKKEEGGRAGFIIVRMQGDIIHPISWSARKLKRVARSSSTAELLGAADAVSHLLYLSSVIKEIIGARHSPSTRLVIDSHCLYRLCSTTNDPRESLNKIDLSAIREAFRPGSLDAISWQPGCYHIADALTKDNRVTSLLLMKALADGQHPPHPSSQTTLSSAACPLTVDGSASSQLDTCENEDDCPSSMIRDDSSEHEPRSDSMLQ